MSTGMPAVGHPRLPLPARCSPTLHACPGRDPRSACREGSELLRGIVIRLGLRRVRVRCARTGVRCHHPCTGAVVIALDAGSCTPGPSAGAARTARRAERRPGRLAAPIGDPRRPAATPPPETTSPLHSPAESTARLARPAEATSRLAQPAETTSYATHPPATPCGPMRRAPRTASSTPLVGLAARSTTSGPPRARTPGSDAVARLSDGGPDQPVFFRPAATPLIVVSRARCSSSDGSSPRSAWARTCWSIATCM